MGLDSLYCGKWRKISKSRRDLDLDRTMPKMSNSSELFLYTTVCSSFTSIEPLFFELSCTQTDRHHDRHTDRQTDTHQDRQTDNNEYSIVAVDKPQL